MKEKTDNSNRVVIAFEEPLKVKLGQPSVSLRKGPKGTFEYEIKAVSESTTTAALECIRIAKHLENEIKKIESTSKSGEE